MSSVPDNPSELNAAAEHVDAQAPGAEEVVDSAVASDSESDGLSPDIEEAPGDSGGGAVADDASVPAGSVVEEDDASLGEDEAAEEENDDGVVVEPLEYHPEDEAGEVASKHQWYILKVQVNREDSIRDALERRVKINALEHFFGDIVVPTEDIAEFNKSGKRRVVKRKLYPGYIMVNMTINDDSWFLVRETPGIGDFTGSAGKPTPMDPVEVDRILRTSQEDDEGEVAPRTAIPFNPGDTVRVKEGYFENFEGNVDSIDEANGRVTVMINIFGRSTPVELEHWQIEAV